MGIPFGCTSFTDLLDLTETETASSWRNVFKQPSRKEEILKRWIAVMMVNTFCTLLLTLYIRAERELT